MAYSSAEINRISGSRLAVQGRKYIEQNGDVWIGTKDNRLTRLYLKDKQIGIELNSTDPVVNLQTYLRNLKLPKTKQIVIDFGSELYQTYKIFTIEDSDVLTSSFVKAEISYDTPPNKQLDDIEMDNITVHSGQIELGSFQVIVRGLEGSLHDKFLLNYTIL